MKYLALLLLLSCANVETFVEASLAQEAPFVQEAAVELPPNYLNKEGTTIASRVIPGEGFERVDYPKGTFGEYLQHRPLKPHGAKVFYYNGDEKYTQDHHAAVLDMDVGVEDLQQCADAVMRLRAEFLLEEERYSDIHFNFVNGFNADYARWRKGDRIWIKGNKAGWKTGTGPTTGPKAFKSYLRWVFMYANTASLSKEVKAVPIEEIEAGDLFLIGGFPGHTVIVVDKAMNATTGEVEVLLAQSFMPAQSVHVLKNPKRSDGNPWHSLTEFAEEVETIEYWFKRTDLRRF
jgi:hypothetical protein